MPALRVMSFGVSLDGFGAGPQQDLEHPLGVGGPNLMEWFFPDACHTAEGQVEASE